MKITNRLAAISGAVLFATTLQAGTITQTLGASAGFADGSTNARVGTWNTAVAGNASPFNAFNGSDVNGPNFSASWQFSYGAVVDPIVSAMLTIGIYDIDSAASGSQIASYLEGSTDITSLLNALAEGLHSNTGAVNNEYNILTIALPSSTFADLAGGSPLIALALQGPGLGVLGETTSNGAGIDFSTITITTDTTGAVPEPATWLLSAGGIGAGLISRRLRRA